MSHGSTDHSAGAVRAARPRKPPVDVWRPHAVLDETERRPGGGHARCRTVFAAGAECPFSCVFCDLWRYTSDAATPPGAIPRQLQQALAGAVEAGIDTVKLYNASNFFEPRAVPTEDHAAIAAAAAPFGRLIVESHPRLVDARRAARFAARLTGTLEIAMGLETVHPVALPRLGKQITVETFARAAAGCVQHGIAVRAFVLIGAPFVPHHEDLIWVQRSVHCALDAGATHVTLIPVRSSPGAMTTLAVAGDFAAPTLRHVEAAFEAALALQDQRNVVSIDVWDLEQHAHCRHCGAARIARLRQMEALGHSLPPVDCEACTP
ncbi:MAG: radical SAM protein [Planctomycetota bacterium]